MPAGSASDNDKIALVQIAYAGGIEGNHDRAFSRLSSNFVEFDPSPYRRSSVTLAQIAPGDLDIRIIGQLPATNLSLRDQFKPDPVPVLGFDAALRRRGIPKQVLEHAPANTRDAFIVADTNTELDGGPFGVPAPVWEKPKEHCNLLPGEGSMFLYCSYDAHGRSG
jgi:hypothetical protein